ncbi:hypothetical protein Ae168Ps1_1574c [Pseudonocardia sp. Ae168_Ps1]|nr:hypothetical protein Ae168Ps1_1574c [Pseudonocardia sp. Ae168_Ps1]
MVDTPEIDDGLAGEGLGERRQHHGAHTVGVLRGQRQLGQRLLGAGAHGERVEEHVVTRPRDVDRLALRALEIGGQGHGESPSTSPP